MMAVTILMLIIAAFLLGGFNIADWITHVSMVKSSSSRTYGWAGYKKFIEEFEKANWDYHNANSISFPNSLFGLDEYGKDQYHANIITFNHNGMIINNPISYIFVKKYVRKHIKNNVKIKRVENKWR